MEQIQAIYRSAERHLTCYPELKKATQYVGTIQGRVELLVQKKFKELKDNPSYASLGDTYLMDYAKKWVKGYKVGPSKNVYAYSHGAFSDWGLAGIAFNTMWKGDKIDTSLASDVKSKWHPVGTGTLKAVFDHELGHEIDRLIGLRTNSDFLKLYNEERAKGKEHIVDNLSSYGYKNSAEFIAEAWSEYLNNEKPRPIAVAVGTIIKKLYAEKYHTSGSTSEST